MSATPTEVPNQSAPVPAAAAPAVVRRGRGAFTSSLKSDDDLAPKPKSTAAPTSGGFFKQPVPTPNGGLATRVLTEGQDPQPATPADDSALIATVAYDVHSATPHPNPNKNKMNRPSANFKSDDPTAAARTNAPSDTVREQLFRKERRRRSIVIVGNTYALSKFSAVRLSNYSEKKPARLENQFLKGVHVSVPLRRLRTKAKSGEADEEGEEEEIVDKPAPEVARDGGDDAEGEENQQRLWEKKEEEDISRARRQANDELMRMAEAFDDGKLHPLTVSNDSGTSGIPDHYSARNTDTNPLLVSPVLTCSRFSSLSNFFVQTFHDLWSLEDTKSQKVSIKLEFGKAFYTRSSRASSFSADSDFQRQRKVPFTNFIEGLNKETSQLYFINDAPLTVARGLDAVVDTKNKAAYTLVKIFFFSKERQSHIVVRAIWDQQFDCFELTDIEHIGITFSWLVLNLEDVPLAEQQRSQKANEEGVFLRHALPVEVQFRAFQRKKTLVGHPLEKKAKFILRKLTVAEHDRLRYGHGSYDSVDFHAIARGKDEEDAGENDGESAEGESGENSVGQSPTSPHGPSMGTASTSAPPPPPRSGDVPRLARKAAANKKDPAKEKDTQKEAHEVVAINDDEYEVASINIEHIETRKTKSGIMLDSASGLLIEHFEDHLMAGVKNFGGKRSIPSGNVMNDSAPVPEEGEDGAAKLNAGLTFLQYRSCNIHWKMDPAKSVFDNMIPSLADALEVCEKVLNRANTFEHEEFVSSRRVAVGDEEEHIGGGGSGPRGVDNDDEDRGPKHRGGYFDEDGVNHHHRQQQHQQTRGRGRGGPVGAIGEGFDDDNNGRRGGRAGGYFNRGGSSQQQNRGGRRGGGVLAIDAAEHRHRNNNNNNTSRGGRGGAERGRGGNYNNNRGGYGDGQTSNNRRQEEDLWDMPESNYRPGVMPPPMPGFDK